MSTQPVTLDMSTFKPLGQTEQAQTPAQPQPSSQQGSSPVTLDMSTFKPLGEPQQQTQPSGSTADRVAQGFGAGAAQGLVTAGKIGSKIPGVPWIAEKVGDALGLPKLHTETTLSDLVTGNKPVDPYKAVEQGIKPAQDAATQSLAGKIGFGLEGLAEFISGDEALKGLGYGDRLLKTGKMAKLIEEIPSLKRVIEIGMNAMRTGTVGTTQGLAHGESTEEALKSGAVAAGTGAALEGVTEGVKAIAPTVKKVAGELIPVRASQESRLANAAENVAPTKSLQKFDVNETQPAARRAVGNVATEVRDAALESNPISKTASAPPRYLTEAGVHTKDAAERMTSAMERELPLKARPWGSVARKGVSQHDLDITVEPDSGFKLSQVSDWLQKRGYELSHNEWEAVPGKDLVGFKDKAGHTVELFFPSEAIPEGEVSKLFGSQAETAASFAPRPKALPSVATLQDAAQSLKEQSKPVFEKLDNLTADQEMKFSDWQKQESAAYRRGDIEAVKKAKAEQEKILDTFKGEFEPKDLQNARANWRQGSALQDIHDSLNTKSIVGPTPIELRPKGIPDPGYINGKAFSKQILNLSNDGTLTRAGLTPEHIQALQDLGTLLEKSANVHKFGQLARLTEVVGGAGTVIMHPAAALPMAKAAIPAYVASHTLGRVMTNPSFADGVVKFLKGAEAVGPATAAQVANVVQK